MGAAAEAIPGPLLAALLRWACTGWEAEIVVVTLLEGVVDKARVAQLQEGYREIASDVPEVLVETFLVRDAGDATSFGILTVWESREAVQEMRRQAEAKGSKPGGVLVFESVGVTPTLKVFDVLHHAAQDR